MIRWLVQTVVDHPDLLTGRPPAGLLTPAETEQYASLLSPHRRRDWLLGRWTAKRLVQKHIALADGFCPTLDSFTIEQEPSGAPYIASQYPALHGACEDGRVLLALSISHSNGYAFCAICGENRGQVSLGADIELVEPRAETFIQEFFTNAEVANIDAAPAPLREMLITATWSAKEAVLKAAHLGLRVDARAVQCLPRPAHPRQWTRLHVEVTPTLYAQSQVTGPLRSWWRAIENRLRPGKLFVLTIAAYSARL